MPKIPREITLTRALNTARVSHFLDAETFEFSQVPSLSMGIHGTLRYLNLTFIIFLINIVGQYSLVLCIVSMIDTIRIVDTLLRYTIRIEIRIVSFIKYKYCGDCN